MMCRLVWLSACLMSAACAFERPVNPPQPKAGAGGMTSAAGAGSGGAHATMSMTMMEHAPDAGASGMPAVVVTRSLDPDVILAGGCATTTEQSSLLPSNLLFVVDRSGSMLCNPPPTTSSDECEMEETRADSAMPSKWELTTRAVRVALQTLPPETTAVGVSYFSNDSRCGVSGEPTVPVSKNTPAQQITISSTLAAITPSGSTPLVGATLLAYRYLQTAALNGAIVGNRYAVLITDGQQSDNCSDPLYCTGTDACNELLVQQSGIASGEGANIRTFVIGVPGSERGRTVLSRVAKAGGTAPAGCNPDLGNCHFDVTRDPDFAAGLQSALQSIAGQTLTCELSLPKPDSGVVDLDLVNVVFTPHEGRARVIPQDMHAECDTGADGWRFDAAQGQIRLCGPTCTTVRGDRGGRIDVVLGCPVVKPD